MQQGVARILSSTHPSAFLSLSRAAASNCLFLCSSCLLCFSWTFKENEKPMYWSHSVRLMETLVWQNILTIFINLDSTNRRSSLLRKLNTHKTAHCVMKPPLNYYIQHFCIIKLHLKDCIAHMCAPPHTLFLHPLCAVFIILGADAAKPNQISVLQQN